MEKQYPCPHCDAVLKSRKGLQLHINPSTPTCEALRRQRKRPAPPEVVRAEHHPCSSCGALIVTEINAKRHRRVLAHSCNNIHTDALSLDAGDELKEPLEAVAAQEMSAPIAG